MIVEIRQSITGRVSTKSKFAAIMPRPAPGRHVPALARPSHATEVDGIARAAFIAPAYPPGHFAWDITH
jgi:hypothetical protein